MKLIAYTLLFLLYSGSLTAQISDTTEVEISAKVILPEKQAKELNDSLLQRFDAVLKQYNKERRKETQPNDISSEDLLRTAIKKYMYLKHIYGLHDKKLFTEDLLDQGVVASRQLRSIPMTLMFQKDKTALYGTNMPHKAICDGSCGKCPGLEFIAQPKEEKK